MPLQSCMAAAQSATATWASRACSAASQVTCPQQYVGLRRGDALPGTRRPQADAFCLARASRGGVTMAGHGKFFVGGNWKCNGSKESIAKLVNELNAEKISSDVEVIVSPPFVYLDQVSRFIRKDVAVAAQNCWVGKGGAYTGEVSAEQLKDVGINWVILGHSERRQLLNESNEFVGKKEAYAMSKGLNVIGCIGETLDQRESGKTLDVLFAQLQAMADHLPSWTSVVVAYEPVWAIGTGKVATPQQAQEAHAAIRKWLAKNVSSDVAAKTRIIYGGSVSAANCADLAKEEDIDGFLVGGASLKGDDFATICNAVNYTTKVPA